MTPAGRARKASVAVDLTAVVVAVTGDQPRVLTAGSARGHRVRLPSGPLAPAHRTLEQGLRELVEAQSGLRLGYVEQLYSFGDANRSLKQPGTRVLSIGYLALTREGAAESGAQGSWQDWYRYFPWEDWRPGRPPVLDRVLPELAAWVADAPEEAARRTREERAATAFGLGGTAWNEDRVLERYELAYELGLVQEPYADGAPAWRRAPLRGCGEAMAGDHRRILATGIARLRGKIKYRPVVFELMPPAFTLSQLQRLVETLAGMRLHKPNFRRLVEQQGLVEETGAVAADTGGRPARLVRFRREALLERAAPGLRVRAPRRRRPA